MMQLLTRCLLLTSIAAALPMPVLAQSVPVSGVEAGDRNRHPFNIPAQSLASAINAFSRQSGWQISVASELASQRRSRDVSGNLSPEQALTRLLDGTDLIWRSTGHNAAVIYSAPTGDALVLEPIQVQGSTRLSDTPYRTAGSANVITRDNIERFRGTSVGDIFRGTPGVLVSENRNSGGLDVNIRGMQGQGRVPVLIDGSRQETTVYRGYSGVSSRSYIDPDLIGSIRIDKGPVMTAEGTGATGGVVSVSTLNADDVVRPGEVSGIRLRGSLIGNNSTAPAAGTHAGYYLPRNSYRSDCRFPTYCEDRYLMPDRFAPEHGMDRPGLLDFRGHSASLAMARRFEWGDLVAAYAERDQGNYYAGKHGPTPYIVVGEPEKLPWYTETPVSREGVSPFRAGERIPNTQYSSESVLLKGRFFLPREQSVELSYLRYDSAFGEMMPSQIRSFGQARQWLDSEVLNQTYALRYHWQPVAHDWADLRLHLWHTDTVSHLNTPAVGSVDIADNTPRTDDYQRYGADLSNSMRFYPFGTLQLDYGVSAQWEDMDTDTPEATGFYDGSRSGKRDEFSAFTSVRWQPWPAWTLEAGTRYTRFKSKDNNPLPLTPNDPACVPDGDGGCTPVHYRNHHSGSAPIASLTWEPVKGLQLYARHAEALRMPSLFESTSGWSVSPALDIPLKPEHAINREFGLNYLKDGLFAANDKLRFKVAYFRNHVDDYLTRTQPNAWETGNGLDFFRLRNIDSADFHGWEVNLAYDAGAWFAELSGTRYSHIEVCNVGSYVRYYCSDWGLPQSYINNMIPPKWHASTTLGVRLLQRRLELGARGTFMGQRNRIPRYNAPTGFNPPVLWHHYNLLDVFVHYRHNETLSVDLTVDNVTDRYYLDALSLGLVPAPGRTARLGFTLQF
ncbi:TonB-dependent heme/hemoglobin receptor family protein [Alloalcanivorax dieselolei B5]|uniref:TonB-dependent heme/hemoglobin receptor family protein n=1 Tax=Alcanivorax dieselolei (strain DSM 16502 / CGMCC 1.3690 / MCCC 1A00001 / B-5) TaxID=930169 RepID=K0CDK3_ALCDB|nr:TonB-dependent receptor [Alloalcanivorax dieselolei]AFT69656.1 TonB-dependent heme/hemoglobin receptor family protein [Alloalcanivorax dieselolei B5]GGK03393.1 TonB-dependent receptor [Alloalcanivorax dieselolei]